MVPMTTRMTTTRMTTTRRNRSRFVTTTIPTIVVLVVVALVLSLCTQTTVHAFCCTPLSVTHKTSFLVTPGKVVVVGRGRVPSNNNNNNNNNNKQSRRCRRRCQSSTGLCMFMGSDGGLLGVGTPEVFTVLLVGYFVLGPSDLYKLVKEIGKFIQNIRTLGTDLTTTLEANMESQLQLEELRKAQRELTDAFSFRRSINTNPSEEEAFTTTVDTPRPQPPDVVAQAAVTSVTPTDNGTVQPKRKVLRRRVKRRKETIGTKLDDNDDVNGNVPDLQMPVDSTTTTTSSSSSDTTTPISSTKETSAIRLSSDPFVQEYSEAEKALIDQEFDQYVSVSGDNDNNNNNNIGNPPQMEAAAQSRFQQQLSGNWNNQIMANQDQLEPLAKVMQLLASLEEEKVASTKRLEEEFRKRAEMEEEYYQKQRKVLEEAATQVQASAAATATSKQSSSSSKA